MDKIAPQKRCTGCTACYAICPQKAIAMRADVEGFLYPEIDPRICVDCGKCREACPVSHPANRRDVACVYAAKNRTSEVRWHSSSGGVFTLLAEQVLAMNGAVFGARFNENWEVLHDYTETMDGLPAFCGSKYVQSAVNENFMKAEKFLQSGRDVLFSGTPCQIAGLKSFLRKEYFNLCAVDFICHGVPSPKVWSRYKNELLHTLEKGKDGSDFSNISFRQKKSDWKNYNFMAEIKAQNIKFEESAHKNVFMRGFLSDLYLRPSCYACPVKKVSSGSDITLGDFWGIEHVLPDFDDDKGVGLVLLNTEKGARFFQNTEADSFETTMGAVFQYNPSFANPARRHRNRKSFFSQIDNNKKSISTLIETNLQRSFFARITGLLKKIVSKLS